MPGYRQKRKKNTKKKNRTKAKRKYASIKVRSSALGRAKSTPKKSGRRKSTVRSRKVKSSPTKIKSSRKSLSSRKKRALAKAKELFPRLMEDPEIEMRYLREKRKTDGDIYRVDPQHLEGLKKLRDKKKIKIEDLAGILEYQENSVEPVELEDLPHMQGKVNLLGKDDPDAILGQLKCKDRVNYCFKTSPELWKKCREPSIHDRYILPCKMSTIIDKKIRDICEIDNKRSLENDPFNEMMEELSDEYPCLMEQNIVSFLKRYLSYGNEDKPPLEYRVYFQVKRNMFSEISDIEELVQLEMETWGKMWKEDEFLDAVNNFIGVERMKEIIKRWGSTPQYGLGEEGATEVYKKMIRGQKKYIEGSLTWWTTMLNCPYVVPFIPEADNVDNRILQFLFQMEDSFLEIFDGTQFQMRENSWFVYGEGEMNTPYFMSRDTYRNWYIDTYGKQPKIKEVLRWLKHWPARKRADEVNKLINMKNTFVRLGSSRFQRSRLMPDVVRISEVEMYRYFEEFIDLLNFTTIGRYFRREDERLVDIEREFQNAQYERYQQDIKSISATVGSPRYIPTDSISW